MNKLNQQLYSVNTERVFTSQQAASVFPSASEQSCLWSGIHHLPLSALSLSHQLPLPPSLPPSLTITHTHSHCASSTCNIAFPSLSLCLCHLRTETVKHAGSKSAFPLHVHSNTSMRHMQTLGSPAEC